ncbi:MAG: D-sedoheptulose 7-phosphate isomerase [Snowella sp.]|jgi:D-sedoheptulose 7-phosphate isomerase|nr:D-sedoheptulose 7-phosphate isomerase [Snowella sp.]PZV25654.1 MAG: phosphoheptose isomerase [Snowella sp.]
MSDWIQQRLKCLETAFDDQYCRAIAEVTNLMVRQFRAGKKLLICGNGGSASDSQHIAAEFVGRFQLNREALPAIALSTNTSILTAVGNDYSFDIIFSRQVEALGQPGDIVWGLSTSGKSSNVLHALKRAKDMGLITVGMAGNQGGLLQEFADYPLFVAEKNTPYIQEIHLITYHQICEQVEAKLFAKAGLEAQFAV